MRLGGFAGRFRTSVRRWRNQPAKGSGLRVRFALRLGCHFSCEDTSVVYGTISIAGHGSAGMGAGKKGRGVPVSCAFRGRKARCAWRQTVCFDFCTVKLSIVRLGSARLTAPPPRRAGMTSQRIAPKPRRDGGASRTDRRADKRPRPCSRPRAQGPFREPRSGNSSARCTSR